MKRDPNMDDPLYWKNRPIELAREFIKKNSKVNEEAFLQNTVELNSNPISFLNLLLSKEPEVLIEILSKLSLRGRRYFLFKLNGFAIHRTAKAMRYSSKKLQNYLDLIGNDIELIRRFALEHQVPPSWLECEEVHKEWEYDFIKCFAPSFVSIDAMVERINKERKFKYGQVNGVCLNAQLDGIYLRLEYQKSFVCLDVYNEINPIDQAWLIDNLERYFLVIRGYKKLITPRLSLMCSHGYIEMHTPIGFNKI